MLSLGLATCRSYLFIFSFSSLVMFHASAIAGDALDRTVSLDIAPNSALEDALIQWGAQAGVQVMMDTNTIGPEKAQGVRGTFRASDALSALLNGSGLSYKVSDATVTVLPTSELDEKNPSFRIAEGEPSSQPSQVRHTREAHSEQTETADEVPPATGREDQQSAVLEEVVVTGSHIRGAKSIGSPLIELSRSDIDNSGYTSTNQLIESLPQNFNGGSPQLVATQGAFSREFSQYSGTSSASLRGLGDSTLTLLDGHRLASTGGTNGSDIGSIPLVAIEKAEILPDGASSIYGADAVGGVINVVLRKDFQGAQATAAYTEPTRSGGGQQALYSLVAGTNWDRGNALISYSGQNQDELLARDRSFSRAAADPTTLFPALHSNSVTAYVNQSLASNASVYAEVLYDRKTVSSNLSFSSPGYSFVSYSPGDSSQYAVSTGVVVRPSDSWLTGLDLNAAQDKRNQTLEYGSSISSISNSTDGEYGAELHGDGPLGMLPSGTVKAAFGTGIRRESYELALPESPANGVSGNREDAYAYAEIELPLIQVSSTRVGLESLDLSLSGRYDHYSDFGRAADPKIGLLYRPSRKLRVGASYGKSFRAPLFTDLLAPRSGYLFLANDARFASGRAVALFESGGNSALRPETSRSWTATVDYAPVESRGLALSATYFSYKFENKILSPINTNFRVIPLSDPSLAPFVTLFPSQPQIQTVASSLSSLANIVGPGASLANVSAILDDRFQNASVWNADGVDLHGAYRIECTCGSIELSTNGSLLSIRDQPIPGVPLQRLSGTVFAPPKWRFRTGTVWSAWGWNIGGFVNFTGRETDIYSAPPVELGSFTTVDLHISYTVSKDVTHWLAGTKFSFSALNLLDRNPPLLSSGSTTYPGIGYDSANASPFGRLLTLQVTKTM
jgi:outer membrane receptor protein involved in Fe transport